MLKGYIGNTDFKWFTFLRERQALQPLEEVNFWQPGGGRGFRAIAPGAPFFFKLKKPHNKIAGFGYFAYHSQLPVWLAWESFGEANGADSLRDMIHKTARYRGRETVDPAGNYFVGCLMIAQPIFFDEADWIDIPNDWAQNIVSGKTYDITSGEGKRIFEACRARAGSPAPEKLVAQDDTRRYGDPQLVRPRIGQGTFRALVTDAYDRACCVTHEHSLPVLEAAHVKPYAEGGSHEVSNGLLLRSDVHKLFDRGYVTVTPDLRFEVSRRLKEDFENGKSYYGFHGERIAVPEETGMRPDVGVLRWHNERLYLG